MYSEFSGHLHNDMHSIKQEYHLGCRDTVVISKKTIISYCRPDCMWVERKNQV